MQGDLRNRQRSARPLRYQGARRCLTMPNAARYARAAAISTAPAGPATAFAAKMIAIAKTASAKVGSIRMSAMMLGQMMRRAMADRTTWRQDAAAIIAEATKELSPDATLQERKRVVAAAKPHWAWVTSWGEKSWLAARRDYLVRYGYVPMTKARKQRDEAVCDPLPLFEGGADG